MTKRLWISALLGVGALFGSACGGPDNPCPTGICVDAQFPDGGGTDAGDAGVAPDTGVREDGGPCALTPGRASGAACTTGDRCLDPLLCQPEVLGEIPAMNTVAVLPDGGITQGRPFPYRFYGNSYCYDDCNPNAAMDECGDCGTCTTRGPQGTINFGAAAVFPATSMIEAVCRNDCTPSLDDNGGCRDGYSCDVWSGTCVDACLNDTQCEFGIGDPDGDGAGDILDFGAGSGRTCSMATGRCDIPGDDSANAGDPCTEDTDCEDNGLCLSFGDDGGYCARIGCARVLEDGAVELWEDFACDGTDEICDVRAFGDGISVCLEGCTVGAEATNVTQRRGTGGGNPTCADPGMACFWSGTNDGTGERTGSCLPGNFNDEPAYDVGTACITDEDCFSPFGYGRCLFLNATDRVQTGICAIGGCQGGTMGVPVSIINGSMTGVTLTADVQNEVCNIAAGDLCVGFGPATTFCVHSCDTAAECPTGYACPALLSDDTRICWPNCTENADCRTGTTCRNTTGGTCGMGQECYCSDAMPAPDAGTATDGGTTGSDAGTTTDAGDAGTSG